MRKSTRSAFTLVELIVVITILAVLGTIGFISMQGYSADARNAKRTSDVNSMWKVLSLYITTQWRYPEPTNWEEVTYSWAEAWTQGTFWEDTRKELWPKNGLSEIPVDPLTYTEYTYSISNTKREYEIAVSYEWEVAYNKEINLPLTKIFISLVLGTEMSGGDTYPFIKISSCSILNGIRFSAIFSLIIW